MTGILRLADSIKAELEQFFPEQRKTQRGKLSLLVATMLDARSANLMDLAAALPLETDRTDMRSQQGRSVLITISELALISNGSGYGWYASEGLIAAK
jgi:hypothetical protein